MSKRDITVFDNSVFVDSWNYIKPTMKLNKDGEMVFILQMCFGPCEWWKWSMDKQGKFWVEYKWCENGFLIPNIVSQRIRSYSMSDFAKRNEKKILSKIG